VGSPKLEVVGVSREFSGPRGHRPTQALAHVDLSVAAGEFLAIIGPSGCGKTTLLHIIDGLLPPTAGHVLVDGQRVLEPGRDRAVVFQDPALLPWRTVARNVAYGLECLGVDRRRAGERARGWLELVGLAEFGDHYPHQLSGGMRQRANLARALAVEPDVLLMDEPFASLDAQARETLQAELLALCARTGKTTVFVTHDIVEAIYLADAVTVLTPRPGRVQCVIPVPAPRPRDWSVRREPWFLACEDEIRRLLGQPGV
jgi:NitT/TauT family transport system ATP-binding protein